MFDRVKVPFFFCKQKHRRQLQVTPTPNPAANVTMNPPAETVDKELLLQCMCDDLNHLLRPLYQEVVILCQLLPQPRVVQQLYAALDAQLSVTAMN